MPSPLFNRSLGLLDPRILQQVESARRVKLLHAAPHIRFDGRISSSTSVNNPQDDLNATAPLAHPAGSNSLTVDKFDGSLLSGGADASITLWDLEATLPDPSTPQVHRPQGTIPKSAKGHSFGITSLSFYPFDPYAFLSSSYDHVLRVWDTLSLKSAASFTLPAPIYAHDISATATHLLVAAATKNPHVRLLDLRSGSATHSLAGHDGAVLGVAWSPIREYTLASAGADGCVRLWDIRRAGNVLGLLDHEDSVGINRSGSTSNVSVARSRRNAKAHVGPCNGITFSEDGLFIVTCGHDERIRVWNASTGANTLVHFGPTVRNGVLATVQPLVVPLAMTGIKQQILLFPSGSEVLMLDLHEGTLLQRLRTVPGITARARGEKGLQQRVTGLAWRAGHCEAYSAHSTGQIKAWAPRSDFESGPDEDTEEDEDAASSSERQSEASERKRKREELNEMFREMTKQKITFT